MSKILLFTPDRYIVQDLDWAKMVWEPMDAHRYIEAFAVADALIDNMIESLLRQVYNSGPCQDLINQIHLLRSKVGFDGINILAILKNKKLIDEKLYSHVIKFKQARNSVLHTVQGEHELIDEKIMPTIKSQEEFDQAAKKAAKQRLDEAFQIFCDLLEVSDKIAEEKKTAK